MTNFSPALEFLSLGQVDTERLDLSFSLARLIQQLFWLGPPLIEADDQSMIALSPLGARRLTDSLRTGMLQVYDESSPPEQDDRDDDLMMKLKR